MSKVIKTDVIEIGAFTIKRKSGEANIAKLEVAGCGWHGFITTGGKRNRSLHCLKRFAQLLVERGYTPETISKSQFDKALLHHNISEAQRNIVRYKNNMHRASYNGDEKKVDYYKNLLKAETNHLTVLANREMDLRFAGVGV